MIRTCGRPTRMGSACARQLVWYETACVVHATEAELAEATARLRRALHHTPDCGCGCHGTIQPGLVPCPRCDR